MIKAKFFCHSSFKKSTFPRGIPRFTSRKRTDPGPNRDGIFEEKHLLDSWPKEGPGLLWFTDKIGIGYSQPVVAGDKIYITGEIDSTSYLSALDLKGELVWKSPNGIEFTGKGYDNTVPGSRSTPTVISDLVYVASGNGRIGCFEAGTGKERWAINVINDFKGIHNDVGYSESPLVDEKKLYFYTGAKEMNFVALDRFSGNLVWSSKALGDTVAHCSAMMIKLPLRDIIVTFSVNALFGLDATTGELLWSHKQHMLKYNQHNNTPVFKNGYKYYVAGDGNGGVKLEVSPEGTSIKEVWKNPEMVSTIQGFVVMNDRLYCHGKNSWLKSFDLKTGQAVDSLRVKLGNIISADGKLFCYSDNGTVNLISVGGDKMKITGTLKIEKGINQHFAHPTIHDGVLYLRHGNALMAYDIRK